jgi:hypothetical protein
VPLYCWVVVRTRRERSSPVPVSIPGRVLPGAAGIQTACRFNIGEALLQTCFCFLLESRCASALSLEISIPMVSSISLFPTLSCHAGPPLNRGPSIRSIGRQAMHASPRGRSQEKTKATILSDGPRRPTTTKRGAVRPPPLPGINAAPDSLVLPCFSSGLFRAMFAMKEIWNGKEVHRRVSS